MLNSHSYHSAISSSLSAFLRFFRQKRAWIFRQDSLIHRCLKAFIPYLLSCTMFYACLWHIPAHLGSTSAATPPLPLCPSQSNFLHFCNFRSKSWLGISAWNRDPQRPKPIQAHHCVLRALLHRSVWLTVPRSAKSVKSAFPSLIFMGTISLSLLR